MIDRRLWIAGRLAALGSLVLFAGCLGGFGGGRNHTLNRSAVDVTKRVSEPAASGTMKSSTEGFHAKMAAARKLEEAGKYAQARSAYRRLVTGHPERYQPYHRLGVVANHLRRHREAQTMYTEALRLNRNDSELINDLGYSLYLHGDLEKAEMALRIAVAMNPRSTRYRNNLGLVLGHLGRYDEALKQFQRGGSEADAHYNLAFVRASRNEIEEAKTCFRRALAVDSTHKLAGRALASFERCDDAPGNVPADVSVAENDLRWVPYVEDPGARQPSAAERASHTSVRTAKTDDS